MLKIRLTLTAVFFVAMFSAIVEAQAEWRFVTTKKVVYLKNRDAALEKAIRKWKKSDRSEDFRYHYNTIDLNDDGKLDALVSVSGFSFCGTGGCPILIFKGDGEKYSLLTEMSVSHTPIFVGVAKTNGWRDLLMEVYGGGIKPYFSWLKFDGKSYPENPTVEPALPKRSRAKFVEYLSGIENVETGFDLNSD